jgi:pSer/pThr/pTyr-binding forkhead associated (FHA) protein
MVQKSRPHRKYETRREIFLLGRSKECEIVIGEPHVSRRQAEVREEDGRHYIRNLGRTPLQLNGRPTSGDFLETGDEIAFGDCRFTYLPEGAPAPEEAASEAQTLLVPALQDTPPPQRLVCSHPSGQTTTHPIDGGKFLIGRSAEADLAVDDPSVSRRHCLIEERGGDYYARNISASSPIAVNDEVVTEKRLSSGDRIRIGPYALTFFSSRPEASRKRPGVRRGRRSLRAPALAGLAAAAAGAALLYAAWGPWQTGRELEAIAGRIAAGSAAEAEAALKPLLARDLTEGHRERAQRLWVQAALETARAQARAGHIAAAVDTLARRGAPAGAGPEAAALREQLHAFRLSLARQAESGGQTEAALSLYAAIPEESPHYVEARKALQRLWLTSQKEHFQQQTVNQLLQEAEALYAARRYFTPIRQNAYSLYRAVLAIEPENETAGQRISEIQARTRAEGEAHFRAGEWPQALAAFERYCLIDPEDAEVRQKISASLRHQARSENPAAAKPASARRRPAAAPEGERHRVERVLAESGARSDWIIRYLFEEKPREDESETPW